MTYNDFLQGKIDVAEETGFDADPAEINPALKPHQRDAVIWALKGGRRALFESFGLGKTIQQLEWARIVHEHLKGANERPTEGRTEGESTAAKRQDSPETRGQGSEASCEGRGAKVLIILPLGVKQEFQLDAERVLKWEKVPPYVRTDAEALMSDAPILLSTHRRYCPQGKRRQRRAGIRRIRPGWSRLRHVAVARLLSSKAYADAPVTRSKDEYTRAQWQIDAHGYWRSSGDRLVTKEELANIPIDRLQKVYRQFSRDNVYSYAEHIALAKRMDAEGRLPATFMVVAPGSWSDAVWDDINRMRTYNTTQSQRRQQLHVCPLQIDIVDRLIDRYSNPGDTILDPFGGIMTVPAQAVKKGRFGIGVELNSDYFRDGVGYLQGADSEVGMPTLFDFLDMAAQ